MPSDRWLVEHNRHFLLTAPLHSVVRLPIHAGRLGGHALLGCTPGVIIAQAAKL